VISHAGSCETDDAGELERLGKGGIGCEDVRRRLPTVLEGRGEVDRSQRVDLGLGGGLGRGGVGLDVAHGGVDGGNRVAEDRGELGLELVLGGAGTVWAGSTSRYGIVQVQLVRIQYSYL
jgi:hypothetical protein